MMNNPMSVLVNSFRRGGNPIDLINSIPDPRAARAMRIIQGKSGPQLQQIAENMCREQGITPADVARSLGLN